MSSIKLKRFIDIYTGNSISDGDKDKYTIQNENTIPYISTKDIEVDSNKVDYYNDMHIDISKNTKFKIADKNSILLCIEGGSAGKKIAQVNQKVCFVNKLCCFNPSNEYNKQFVYFYLQSDLFLSQFNINLTGLIGGVSQSIIKEFNIPFYNIDLQNKIANYLDSKISKINQIIEDNKKEIELLEEYKKNIITEIVCNVGYKKIKIKNLCLKITDGAHISPETENGIYDFVSVVDITDNGMIDFIHCLKTSKRNYEQLVRNCCKPIINDVLISKDGTIGKTSVISFNHDFVVSSSLVILRPNINCILPFFLNYCLNSNYIQDELNSYLTGSGLKRVSIQKYKNLQVYVPDLEMQERIVNQLDDEIKKINKVISYRKKIIEKLEEYKSSLIYEVITGKKEV